MARRAVLPLFIPHLGCPNECVFCDQRRISGSPLPVSGKSVSGILDRARSAGNRGLELAFYGGSFTAIPETEQEELLGAAQPFLRDGTVSSLRVSTRPDAVDDAVIVRLRRFGVKTVELGAQSMSDHVLRICRRGHTVQDTIRASEMLRRSDLSLVLQMMTGLPGSDRSTDLETADAIVKLHPDAVRIYPTVIVRGTVLEKMWRSGEYRENTVEDAVKLCAEIVPMFEEAGIPVIRIGLNPTEELSRGEAAGGAYHPAFGELVRSEIMFHRISEKLAVVPAGAEVIVVVPPKELSITIGQHRQNITRLLERFPVGSLRVTASDEDTPVVRWRAAHGSGWMDLPADMTDMKTVHAGENGREIR